MTEDLYRKFILLSDSVKKKLRSRGIAIPTANQDGTVSIGAYTIIKDDNGNYAIITISKEYVVRDINLPQTAILVANNLALGRRTDDSIIVQDKNYGYALFEEQLHTRAARKSMRTNPEYADLMLDKGIISKYKKEACKKQITRSFEKLRKLA